MPDLVLLVCPHLLDAPYDVVLVVVVAGLLAWTTYPSPAVLGVRNIKRSVRPGREAVSSVTWGARWCSC